MQVKELGSGRFLLVLDRGEELVATVSDFLEEREIKGGAISGIGALKNHTVAWFDVEKQEYLKRTFEENMELGNLVGSIGTVDGKPFLHAHVTISGPELVAFTGHLLRGDVAVTAELFVTDFGVELPREEDEELGLKLFALSPPEETEEAAGGEPPDGEDPAP